jgi:hypothetical protein
MKAKIPSVKIQKLPPEGTTTGGTGTPTPDNVDVWPGDVDDNNVPDRDDEGNIVRPEIAKFDSVVTSATPAIASVLNDWSSNFSTASLEINP